MSSHKEDSTSKSLDQRLHLVEDQSAINKPPSGFESPFPLRKRSPSVTDRTGGKFTSNATPHIDEDLQKILQKRLNRVQDPDALEKTEFAIAQSRSQGKPTVETKSVLVS